MTPFDWSELFALARRLAASGASEAEQRTAINRAYYAVFHAASAFVRARGLVQLTERITHQKIWNLLANDPDHDRADVGRGGDGLKRLRIDADYRSPFPGDLATRMSDALTDATYLLDAIDRLS